MASVSGVGSPSDQGGQSPHPVNLPHIKSLDLKARYHSARCGGDFFDAVALGSRVVFVLADIAGKKPDTHAIASEVQRVFRTRAQELFEHPDANESESIATLARDINRSLIEAAGGIRFAPAFLGCYNLTLHVLTYLFAGYLHALFHDASTTRALEPCGIPLGLFSHSTYEPVVAAFDPEAKLLLVTKGNNEGRKGPHMLDEERIQAVFEDSPADASAICDAVLQLADDPGKASQARVQKFLRSRNRKYCEDLTAVALVRRGDAQPREQSAVSSDGDERHSETTTAAHPDHGRE